MEYRVEDKYIISDGMMEYLMYQLNTIMEPDTNMCDGPYTVRSIYFDDRLNTCLDEIEGGYNHREKFRIRTYNNDLNFIRLELKSKNRGRTRKKSTVISHDKLDSIINNKFHIEADDDYLIKKLWVENKTRNSPKNGER